MGENVSVRAAEQGTCCAESDQRMLGASHWLWWCAKRWTVWKNTTEQMWDEVWGGIGRTRDDGAWRALRRGKCSRSHRPHLAESAAFTTKNPTKTIQRRRRSVQLLDGSTKISRSECQSVL